MWSTGRWKTRVGSLNNWVTLVNHQILLNSSYMFPIARFCSGSCVPWGSGRMVKASVWLVDGSYLPSLALCVGLIIAGFPAVGILLIGPRMHAVFDAAVSS